MPPPKVAPYAETTLPKRNYDDHVPETILKKVNEAPGNITQLRCLIDNMECRHVVDYAHVLSRADGRKDKLISNLERSWGIEPETLNSNSHRNIFRLSAKFHRLFDEGNWLLLPEMKILDEYNQHYVNQGLHIDFPVVKSDLFNYTLVAHPKMKQVAIHRRNEAVGINSLGAFKTFVYPYENFPVIVSHIHPRFVICNSGQKLHDLDKFEAFQKGDKELDDRLEKASLLYYEWTHPKDPPVESTPASGPSQTQRCREAKSASSDLEASDQSDEEQPAKHPTPIISTPSLRSLYETPKKRDPLQTPQEAKDKVIAAAGGEFCIIDKTNGDNALEYAHLLPCSASDMQLTNLEYWWKMDYGTLNVNTHQNIFLVGKNLDRQFDANSWFLLPEDFLIKEYFTAKGNRAKFPEIDSPPYKYTLVVHPDMQNLPIHQQVPSADKIDSGKGKSREVNTINAAIVSADAFVTHVYPFTGFPTITSHVHPRFVLYNTGSKLSGARSVAYGRANPQLLPTFRDVIAIYKAWTSSRIPEDFYSEDLPPNTRLEDAYLDNKTSPRRIPFGKKRSAPQAQGTPTRKSKRAKTGGGKDCGWLDDATLTELDHDRSPKKAWEEKVAWIQAWVRGLPLDTMDVDEVPMDVDHDLTDR